jgi:hypothetical protein
MTTIDINYKNITISKDDARNTVVRISIGDDPMIEIQMYEDDGSLCYNIFELTEDDAIDHGIQNTIPEYWEI